ncbi:hypothetical protein [Nocardioides albus]|uniref:Uncharacterized protein n=1 Tax=Nocardioides albus TaxID=1841 RepID=A0A7W5A2A3_9ACTN|nr:hypothetical protein [Nocardioides albus]MBB3088176.1 hypothetical protein [Nocardioides albus]GGU23007.1 hypothetical protein GCM10007979_22430 [Nocardioides albus]
MPKPVAPTPVNWASMIPAMQTFKIDQLNRVVLDYGYIELEALARRNRRPPILRMLSPVMYWIAIAGVLAPFLSVAAILGSEDPMIEIVGAFAGGALGCASILYFYLPWSQSDYRQWDPTASTLSVLIGVFSAVALALIFAGVPDTDQPAILAAPIGVLFVVVIGTLVARYRRYSVEAPPRINVRELSSDEMAVLLKSRRQGLVRLRGRGIITHAEFETFDKSPLSSQTGSEV